MKTDLLTRFWAKVDQSAGPDACWPWTAYVNVAGKSYGRSGDNTIPRPRFRIGGPRKGPGQVHVYCARFALSITDGVPLDEREHLEACHKPVCTTQLCCNPAHLYWGTPEENRADRWGKRDADVLPLPSLLDSDSTPDMPATHAETSQASTPSD